MTSPRPARLPKKRVDVVLVAQGKVETRARAQAFVMAGRVRIGGVRIDKPGTIVSIDAALDVDAEQTYVSRGGHKLEGALASFAALGLDVRHKIAADFGASTGGFVDCLLQRGATRVHAIDVGHGLLHERLRQDARVILHERTNARTLDPTLLGEQVELVVIDASFIGLAKLLDAARAVLVPGGELLALIKPQFEAGREEVSRGQGVIRDEEVRTRIVMEVLEQVRGAGFEVLGDAACVLTGPKGNREHFVYGRGG